MRFPEAKQTTNGVYIAKIDSFRNLIQNRRAIPSSLSTVVMEGFGIAAMGGGDGDLEVELVE